MKVLLIGLLMLGSFSAFSLDTQCGKLLYAKVSGLEDMGFNYVLVEDNPVGMVQSEDVYFFIDPQSSIDARILRATVENWDYDNDTYPDACITVENYYDALRIDGSSVRVVTDFELN